MLGQPGCCFAGSAYGRSQTTIVFEHRTVLTGREERIICMLCALGGGDKPPDWDVEVPSRVPRDPVLQQIPDHPCLIQPGTCRTAHGVFAVPPDPRLLKKPDTAVVYRLVLYKREDCVLKGLPYLTIYTI